jgi:hypothetical protein
MRHLLFIIHFSLFVVFLAGCGGSNSVKLNGKVTFEDGTPLDAGTVCFETDTYTARGIIKPDGTYTVGSVSANDGLPQGKYRVFITDAEKIVGAGDGKMGTAVPLVDTKFTNGNTSGLTCEVPVAGGKFNFQVEPYAAKKK